MKTTSHTKQTRTCSPGACTALQTLNMLGKKWSLAMLYQLCQGSKRFGELQRALPGISPRTLTQRLQELERSGIVHRRVYDEMPLRVEYRLTEKGRSLRQVIGQVHDWGERYA
jgi:DNA-binding HxlR family transcriptional regulator